MSDDAKFEIADKGPPARGFYVGKCSDYEMAFGCFRVIDHGARSKGAMTVEEAAHHICVD